MGMFRSVLLFRVIGIPVRAHATLALSLPLFGLLVSSGAGSHLPVLGTFPAGFLLVLGLLGSVLLHEVAHCLAARRQGIRTSRITLFPLGGIAELDRIPTDPRQEMSIAIAGPAASVILALSLGMVSLVLDSEFLLCIAVANLALALLNLLPAFPMDGGRILRALLACRLPHAEATRVAARVGMVNAAAVLCAGIAAGSLVLAATGAYVFCGALSELRSGLDLEPIAMDGDAPPSVPLTVLRAPG